MRCSGPSEGHWWRLGIARGPPLCAMARVILLKYCGIQCGEAPHVAGYAAHSSAGTRLRAGAGTATDRAPLPTPNCQSSRLARCSLGSCLGGGGPTASTLCGGLGRGNGLSEGGRDADLWQGAAGLCGSHRLGQRIRLPAAGGLGGGLGGCRHAGEGRVGGLGPRGTSSM